MKYRYKISKKTQSLLLELKALKIVFDKLPVLPHKGKPAPLSENLH